MAAAQNGGMLLGDDGLAVWDYVNVQPFDIPHYATYPKTLIAPIVRAAVPAAVWAQCGMSYKRTHTDDDHANDHVTYAADCTCDAKYHPAYVCDPFHDARTTVLALLDLPYATSYIGIDASTEYLAASTERAACRKTVLI